MTQSHLHMTVKINIFREVSVCTDSTVLSIHRTLVKVRNENLIFLFLNQNICCGYSKEPF